MFTSFDTCLFSENPKNHKIDERWQYWKDWIFCNYKKCEICNLENHKTCSFDTFLLNHVRLINSLLNSSVLIIQNWTIIQRWCWPFRFWRVWKKDSKFWEVYMSIYVTVYIEIYIYTYIIYILDFGEFKQDSEFFKIYVFPTIGSLYHYLVCSKKIKSRDIFIRLCLGSTKI